VLRLLSSHWEVAGSGAGLPGKARGRRGCVLEAWVGGDRERERDRKRERERERERERNVVLKHIP
jgi:hypothetical protein